EHEEMIEHGVIGILVAPRQHGERAGNRGHLLVEHLVAQALCVPDLALLARQPHFETAEPSIDLGRLEAPAEGANREASFAKEWQGATGARLEHQPWEHRTAAKSARKPS